MNRLFAILLLLIGNSTFSQNWITTRIVEFASIDFPVDSEQISNYGEIIFSARDENAVYLVTVKKITDTHSDEINGQLSLFYDIVTDGALKAADGKITSQEDVDIDGYRGLEIEYETPFNQNLPSRRFKRILYVKKHLFIIDFWPFSEQETISGEYKSHYFNSFSIDLNETIENESDTTVSNNPTSTFGYQMGYVFGVITSLLLLVGILIGAIFLLRYFSKKRKKKKDNAPKPVMTISKITCAECEFENSISSKYCMRCGYELPKLNP